MRCSAAFPAIAVIGHHATKRPVANAIAGLASTLPVGPLEIPILGMGICDSGTSVIEARLVSPFVGDIAITGVPARVHADRPLELDLPSVGLGADASAAVSMASWLSAHACLAIAVEVPGQPRVEVSLPISAGPSGSRLILRALVRPSAWANAVSVTVVSLSLAGRPLPSDCLPVTLRVGYNHAPAPEGAVYEAARDGDVAALQAALDAGGSTEEADEVRGSGGGEG